MRFRMVLSKESVTGTFQETQKSYLIEAVDLKKNKELETSIKYAIRTGVDSREHPPLPLHPN